MLTSKYLDTHLDELLKDITYRLVSNKTNSHRQHCVRLEYYMQVRQCSQELSSNKPIK